MVIAPEERVPAKAALPPLVTVKAVLFERGFVKLAEVDIALVVEPYEKTPSATTIAP